jgi:hypothetical protein
MSNIFCIFIHKKMCAAMPMRDQMTRGLARLEALDNDTGAITRPVMADDGRGGMIPTGGTTTHEVICRIALSIPWGC